MFWDLHLHLVPGVDDGAVELEDSFEMARVLVEQGYAGGAVTPHMRPGMFDNDPEPLRAAIGALGVALVDAGISFEVSPGAEHYLDGDLFERVLDGGCIPLGDTRYVLMEAPAFDPVAGLRDLVFRMMVKGLTPVFAHPERCAVFRDVAVTREVVEAGAVLQLDLGSLDGAYGRPARKLAHRLLDAGLYAVAGSDLHNPAQARESLGDWLEVLRKAVGEDGRERLCGENPRRLLDGQALTR